MMRYWPITKGAERVRTNELSVYASVAAQLADPPVVKITDETIEKVGE